MLERPQIKGGDRRDWVCQIIKTFLYLHALGFLNYQRKMDELILELDCLRSKYIHMKISAKAIKL